MGARTLWVAPDGWDATQGPQSSVHRPELAEGTDKQLKVAGGAPSRGSVQETVPDAQGWWEGLWVTTLQMTAFRAPSVPNWHLRALCFPEGDLGPDVWSFFPAPWPEGSCTPCGCVTKDPGRGQGRGKVW